MEMTKNRQRLRVSVLACTSFAGLMAASPLWAQSASVTGPAAEAEAATFSDAEILVTARRREERLQDVPVAVSVIGGSDLAARGVVKLEDVSRAVPALQISSESYGKNVPSFTIRSQRQATNLITQDTSVALYFADVPQARAQGLNAAMFDLSSIQVLKGPQGTLFGRNTTGGAVVVTPQAPTDLLEGYVTGSLGNLDKRSVEAVLNVPISDILQVRFGGQVNRRDGYIHNVFDGSDLEDEHTESWRASVRFKPNDWLENRLVINGFHANENGSGGILRNIGPVPIPAYATALAAEIAAVQTRDRYSTNSNDPHGTKMRTIGISNVTEVSVGEATIKNIFGYRHLNSHVRIDHDASPVTILAGRDDMLETQYSDELQMLGKTLGGNLDYIAGLFYFRETGSANGGNNIFGSPRDLTGSAKNTSKSIFGQVTYRLPFADTISLTAGGRQTWDRRAFDYTSTSGNPPVCFFTVDDIPIASGGVPLNPCLVSRSAKFKNFTYTMTVDWKVARDVLIYAAHRKGYRAGGFNQRATTISATDPFEPEEVKDYELGLKTSWRVGSIHGRLNVAGYHQDYRNIQRNQNRIDSNGNFLGSTVTNAASAKIDGVEVELNVTPVRGLEIGAFYSLSRAKYNEWLAPALVDGSIVFIDQSASPFAAAPKNSGGGSVTYTLPLANDMGDLTLSTNIYLQSVTYGSDGNATPAMRATARLPGYALVNARLEWADIARSGITAAAFVRNLTDKFYLTSGVDVSQAGLGTNLGLVGAPRTYGMEVTFRF